MIFKNVKLFMYDYEVLSEHYVIPWGNMKILKLILLSMLVNNLLFSCEDLKNLERIDTSVGKLEIVQGEDYSRSFILNNKIIHTPIQIISAIFSKRS